MNLEIMYDKDKGKVKEFLSPSHSKFLCSSLNPSTHFISNAR